MTTRGVILPHHLARHAADVIGQEHQHCPSCQEVVRAIETGMAEGRQQFYYLQGGPANGRDGSLPGNIPAELTGYEGGRYVATGERNVRDNKHVYRWEARS